MFGIAAVLFVLAALPGLVMAVTRLRGTNPTHTWAAAHGVLAASGLVVLILAVLQPGAPDKAGYALGLFLIAAVGGFGLFSYALRRRLMPLPLMVAHALLAVVALALLLTVVFGLA